MFVGVIGWTAKNADLDLSIEELSIVKKNKMTIWVMLGINLALGLALNAYILS